MLIENMFSNLHVIIDHYLKLEYSIKNIEKFQNNNLNLILMTIDVPNNKELEVVLRKDEIIFTQNIDLDANLNIEKVLKEFNKLEKGDTKYMNLINKLDSSRSINFYKSYNSYGFNNSSLYELDGLMRKNNMIIENCKYF